MKNQLHITAAQLISALIVLPTIRDMYLVLLNQICEVTNLVH
jgi:hypothetical protein